MKKEDEENGEKRMVIGMGVILQTTNPTKVRSRQLRTMLLR